MVRGNQRIARECYSALIKQKTVDNIYVDELDMRDEVSTRPTPSEELEPVQLGDQLEHLVYIGSVTPHPDEVHSTCNCKSANVH